MASPAWAGVVPREIGQETWLSPSGSPDGRWALATRWKGGAILYDLQTARIEPLEGLERILAVEEVHNATRWHVETDNGPRSFEVQSRRNFRRVDDGGLIIIDVDTNRFRIPDRRALDAGSRDLLDLHI